MTEEVQRDVAEVNGRIDESEDPRVCYQMVQERIQRLRQAGEEIPEDLYMLERNLLTECLSESQGR